ncbi:bifunctional 2-dehydro-3-deoxygluconokinase/2-dehydro-3-deoxygalactonokinase [Halalkalicoccus jeotgali]|uniref:PfkB domain protein n=1 Tax=Halalkalicoccus jeotgali (strain DSM 18796 / CECT 7217 / JCM 14584 / KCTC 4019 / B3) TaxID=795797 RepID=D8J8L4_HALJB|nr:bifunctional 2-dehydro-3-deoxygluconokinase/2-dehydro-3-deoxygalactonokinase [Halalkalicoccus jeotgali]ADJ16260.1 PfkB domain protein [Halalkalicoccus jeotgali B3]ELY36995.1 PfkB domain-containing protein [Halalkalicoccus jeotgali B3]
MTDLVTVGETMLRLSPPDNERLETATELELRAAGAESNVAVAATRLGTDAVWTSKLPDSPLGRRVTSELESYGLETAPVWSDEGRQGTYYIEFAGEPRGTDVIYDRANAAVTSARAEELPTGRIRESEWFYTSGITPALSDTLEETTETLLWTATDAGTKTAFDLNYRSKLWSPEAARETLTDLFEHVDVLVTAVRDAENVLGVEGSDEAIARELARTWEFETVVLTLGAEGALAHHDGEITRQPAFETETHDPIGTGDAFVGAFLAERIAGGDVASALEYGAATAALKRTIPGDIAIVTPDEVAGVIDAEGSGISR